MAWFRYYWFACNVFELFQCCQLELGFLNLWDEMVIAHPDISAKDNSADLKIRQFSQKYANTKLNANTKFKADYRREAAKWRRAHSAPTGDLKPRNNSNSHYFSFESSVLKNWLNCLRLNCLYISGWIVWISNWLNCLWQNCLSAGNGRQKKFKQGHFNNDAHMLLIEYIKNDQS